MTVTFFGHKDTPKEIETLIKTTLIDLIENHSAAEFYVGNNGNFDFFVCRQLKELSAIYNIDYSVVLAYMPIKKNEYENFEDTIFPEEIANVPKRFAVSYRNKWMINKADVVVTYVTAEYGGAWQFKILAQKQGKKIMELSNLTLK